MAETTRKDGGWRRLTSGAPLAVFVAAGLLVIYQLLPVLELVAIAMLIALVLRTIVRWLEGLGIVPWLAAVMLLGVVGGAGAVVGFVVVPNLVQEARILASEASGYAQSLKELSTELHRSAGLVPNLSGLLEQLQGFLSGVVGSFPGLIASSARIAVDAVGTLIMALYMAYDPGSLIDGSLRLVPPGKRERVRGLIGTIEIRLRGWVVGTGLAMLIVGGGAGVGLWVLGVPLPLTFGVLAGVLELIPYFGPVVGALLPTLVALTVSPIKALLVLLLFVVIDQAEVHLVQPLVMGHGVRVHPVAVILSFLVLGKLLGFGGLLLAVPAAAFLATLVDELTRVEKDPCQEDAAAAPRRPFASKSRRSEEAERPTRPS
jgi:predicted PurR-regulated permease PerM